MRIERELRKLNYNYLRRRQTKWESRRLFGNLYRHQVKKEELAQAIAACVLDPYLVRLGKDRLFEDPDYRRIFDGRSPSEYLAFYCLGRAVKYGGRGDPRRYYAKWVVLNDLWRRLSPELRSGSARRAFIAISERANAKYAREIRPLDQAVNELFECANAFYRAAQAKREGKQEVSTFYKHTGREREFHRLIGSAVLKRRRRRIEALLRKFVVGLEAVAADL